jgi:hypothetical protein
MFREGFSAGYADAYRRFAGYGRPGTPNRGPYGNGGYGGYGNRGYGGSGSPAYGYGYANPATDHGLREGYEKGLEDARKNRSFDARRHEWYRDGDRHYNSRYGSRERYKDLYRRGFQEGYERGYRDGRYRW